VEEGCTVVALVAAVVVKFPGLAELVGSLVLSVNHDYTAVDSSQVLKGSDEVAFIPPISGG
jgi:molybdopterin converting factor small subunit